MCAFGWLFDLFRLVCDVVDWLRVCLFGLLLFACVVVCLFVCLVGCLLVVFVFVVLWCVVLWRVFV